MFRYLRGLFTKQSATSKTFIVGSNQIQGKSYSDSKNQQEGYNQNVIVFRCVQLIAEGVSKVPLVLFSNGKKIESHPLLDLLNKPNNTQSRKEFIQDLISQKLITGNAFVEAAYPNLETEYTKQLPSYLYSLNPANVSIRKGANGLPSAYEYELNGSKVVFPVTILGDSNILHLKSFNPIDHWYGLSPIQPAGVNIDQVNNGNTWNSSLLKNGAKPSGALQTDGNLTESQFERLKALKKDTFQGMHNTGELAVLEGGLKFTPFSLSPTDMDFANGIKMATQMIAFAFGVPYDLVNTDQAKYENLERAYELLWDQAIEPNLKHLLSELNEWLVPRFGKGLELSFDEDSVGAIGTKRDRKRKSLDEISFMTINEKRRAMGLGDQPGGDILLTELNKIPLDQVGFDFDDNEQESNEKEKYISDLIKKGYTKQRAEKMGDLVYDHS